jgi:hypothetical protein
MEMSMWTWPGMRRPPTTPLSFWRASFRKISPCVHESGHITAFSGTLASKPHGTCSPTPSGLGFRRRSTEASVCLSFERFKRWRLLIPGTAKLWESPGQAGGYPLLLSLRLSGSSLKCIAMEISPSRLQILGNDCRFLRFGSK